MILMSIGIFDSGLGGLTVLKEVRKIFPNEEIFYFGDTARVPYGEKTKELIIRYSKEITTTTPIRSFKESILRKVTRSKTKSRNGNYVGLPVANGEAMCHLRKTLKINPTDKWIRKNIKEDYKIYI